MVPVDHFGGTTHYPGYYYGGIYPAQHYVFVPGVGFVPAGVSYGFGY